MSRFFDNDEQPFEFVYSLKFIGAELLPYCSDLYLLAIENFGLYSAHTFNERKCTYLPNAGKLGLTATLLPGLVFLGKKLTARTRPISPRRL